MITSCRLSSQCLDHIQHEVVGRGPRPPDPFTRLVNTRSLKDPNDDRKGTIAIDLFEPNHLLIADLRDQNSRASFIRTGISLTPPVRWLPQQETLLPKAMFRLQKDSERLKLFVPRPSSRNLLYTNR